MAKGGGGGKGAGKGGPKGGPKGGRGGRGGGGGLMGFAHSQVLQAELPIEQQIAAEKQANLAKARQQIGFAKAAAAIMQQAAPAVGDAYTNAANSDAGYSRALGSGVQAQLNQNQQSNNQFLQQMGAPQGALHNAAPVGDVSYGLQGYIPATTLQREGAAWESAAQLAPGNQLMAGQQQAGATLNGPDSTLASLQTDLAKIAGTEPSVYDKLVGMQQAQQRIGISQQSLNQRTAYDNANLGLRQQSINLQGARLQQSIRQAAIKNKQEWARIGISQKSLKLRAAAAQAKLNTGGYSADKIASLKKQAFDAALVLKNGNPKAYPPYNKPVTDPKLAMRTLVDQGIPPSIAMQELRDAGYSFPPNMNFMSQIGLAAKNAGITAGHEQMISRAARARGLDPAAVLAVASQEGLDGKKGDHGTSFGPFQLHAGGALPAQVWARGPQYAQQWAWSPQGITYALDRMAQVARGLRGRAAIAAISRGFEHPANPQAEIAGAWANYGQF